MPKNKHAVSLGRKGGKATSEAKKAASRANVAKARKGVNCPICSRYILFNQFRAKNMSGEITMEWHLSSLTTECRGSHRSKREALEIMKLAQASQKS